MDKGPSDRENLRWPQSKQEVVMATDVSTELPLEVILPNIELVAEDGEPLESAWHLFETISKLNLRREAGFGVMC